jgi:hypothetical protein
MTSTNLKETLQKTYHANKLTSKRLENLCMSAATAGNKSVIVYYFRN